MTTISPAEEFIIARAQKLRRLDRHAAKALIITARTIFPDNFLIQFEAYKLEKEANNYEEAAKCFSYITLKFQNQSAELWSEVNDLAAALRVPENDLNPSQDFYVRMFRHVSFDVQHKILVLTVNHTENHLDQCRLLLLILKRFPKAAITHSPRLLQMIADCVKEDPPKYQEMLVEEALPLIQYRTPDLSPPLVCRIFTISLEYYIRKIIDEEQRRTTNIMWRNIFEILSYCAKVLRWEQFLPFNKNWGQNIYWDKLIGIVANSPTGCTQVLFYATTLFLYSLHCYIRNCTVRSDETEAVYVLVEGFTGKNWNVERSEVQTLEPPQISLSTPISKEISKAFVHAAQCWQLLNTDQFQRDFSKLLLTLPLASWISRFLFDLAIYFGHQEEAKKLRTEMTVKSNLINNLQILSLDLLQGSLTSQDFKCILKILAEMPPTPGYYLDHLTLKVPRHMIFIPLTQRCLVQYCTKAIITHLSRRFYTPNCPDAVLGDLLVLLQLEYPRETFLAEQIFARIASRRSFTYRLFTSYIVLIDFIEEFMHIWHAHGEKINFDLTPSQTAGGIGARRIGTRGADKGVRDDFRSIVKQQISRSNENILNLVTCFISQENITLMQNLFATESPPF